MKARHTLMDSLPILSRNHPSSLKGFEISLAGLRLRNEILVPHCDSIPTGFSLYLQIIVGEGISCEKVHHWVTYS